MALKRKLERDLVDESDRDVGFNMSIAENHRVKCVSRHQSKQLRLVPFPSYQADTDVAMSDAVSDISSLEPVTTEQHHMRLNSGASTASSSDYGDGTSPHAFVTVSKLIAMDV